jgi:hypothetical protein
VIFVTITLRVTRGTCQAAGAVAALAAVAALWATSTWPFDTSPPPLGTDPSLTDYFLSDNVTLGFVRLGVALLAVYVIVSVPALIIGMRWLKGFGTSGLTADDAQSASAALEELKTTVDTLKAQRDAALNLARVLREKVPD